MPDAFHAKTGHILPTEKSQVFQQLLKTEEYSKTNSMKINKTKTKTMVFNPCRAWDFIPEMTVDNKEIVMVEEMQLLGVVVRSDMTWSSNTEHILKKAYKRLWAMRRLKGMGASIPDLKDIYIKQVRSVLELAVPAWNGALTKWKMTPIFL